MDYAKFIKKLELPAGFVAPTRLIHQDIVDEVIYALRGDCPTVCMA